MDAFAGSGHAGFEAVAWKVTVAAGGTPAAAAKARAKPETITLE